MATVWQLFALGCYLREHEPQPIVFVGIMKTCTYVSSEFSVASLDKVDSHDSGEDWFEKKPIAKKQKLNQDVDHVDIYIIWSNFRHFSQLLNAIWNVFVEFYLVQFLVCPNSLLVTDLKIQSSNDIFILI